MTAQADAVAVFAPVRGVLRSVTFGRSGCAQMFKKDDGTCTPQNEDYGTKYAFPGPAKAYDATRTPILKDPVCYAMGSWGAGTEPGTQHLGCEVAVEIELTGRVSEAILEGRGDAGGVSFSRFLKTEYERTATLPEGVTTVGPLLLRESARIEVTSGQKDPWKIAWHLRWQCGTSWSEILLGEISNPLFRVYMPSGSDDASAKHIDLLTDVAGGLFDPDRVALNIANTIVYCSLITIFMRRTSFGTHSRMRPIGWT